MTRFALRIALVAAAALGTAGCYYPYGYYPYGPYRYGYPAYVVRPAPVVVYPGY